MIEFALFDTGPTDLPITSEKAGLLASGTMAEMHRSSQRIAAAQVEAGVLAEKLGFHYYFLAEHHFQPEGAEHSSNPLIVGAAVAARTSRIRIGQMGNILPWWHPIRLAEQAALLDVISGGRLEFGVGRGLQPRETEIFAQSYGGHSADEMRSLLYFEEALDIILKAWTNPSFSYDGQFFRIPPQFVSHPNQRSIDYFAQKGLERTPADILNIADERFGGTLKHTTLRELSVYPQPLQKPHPQIWQPVVMNIRSMKRAARRGMNPMFVGSPPAKVREEVEAYEETMREHDYPDRFGRKSFKRGWDCEAKRGVGHLQNVHIVTNGIGNVEKWARGVRHRYEYLAGFLPPGAIDVLLDNKDMPSFAGSPDKVVEDFLLIKEKGGYDDFLCPINISVSGMGWSEIQEQMIAFSEEVMPHLVAACGGAYPLPDLLAVA